ncbi:MAG: hypothetical protein P8182_12580 [Deltaproteobacteria bacterium]
MKRSLVTVLVLLASLSLAASAIAGQAFCPATQGCPPYSVVPPITKLAKHTVFKETVTKKIYPKTILCKGRAKGVAPLCNPYCSGPGPAVTWSCSWSTAIQGRPVKATYLVTKKAKLLKVGTGRAYPRCFTRGYRPF